MITKKLLVLLLVFGFCHAQDKLGKVTVSELQEKSYPGDTSAAAAILFKHRHTTFNLIDGKWRMTTETLMKIKIYKKSALDLGNVEESFFHGSGQEEVYFNDCATYNLVNGDVQRTKLKSDGEFLERTNKYMSTKKISLPNVKEGSIIEYKLIKHSYSIANPDICYLQYEIPVKRVTYRFYAPTYMAYNVRRGGFLKPEMEQTRMNSTNGDYQETRYVFKLNDVPAMRDEEYVNNINNYRSRIIFELSMYYSSRETINYAADWEGVAKKIYEHEDFGPQLRLTGYFEKAIDSVLNGLTERDQKVNAIFKFVQSRMTWNEFMGYYCETGVRQAYKKRTGNVAEINLMLTAMLRYAGMEANPVLVSTRRNGVALFPSRTAYNYVIAAVEIENDLILLDATNKNTRLNILPLHALNWIGRIIRKNGSSAPVDLSPSFLSKYNVNALAKIDPSGTVNGNIRATATDYSALLFYENFGTLSKETQMERMERIFPGLEIEDINITGYKGDQEKTLVSNYSFTHTGLSEIINNKMYISPLMFFATKENPFKQEKREYPVDFDYPKFTRYTISLTLPQGYEVESLPESQALQMEDNIGTFRYTIQKSGANQIQLVVQQEINTAIVPAEHYPTLQTFYKELIAKENERIVLRKI